MKKAFVTITFLALICAAACKKEKACNEANLEKASNDYLAAALKYAGDPSKANCEAFKKSADAFLDIADNCPDVSQSELKDAKDAVKDLTCQ